MHTQTSSALYNAIMEASGKDRPLMYFTTTTTKGEVMKTFATVAEDIQKWITAEAEVVQIILTRTDNDIYSTVDACPNAMEMWKVIERLKQGESINIQDLETNMYWEFGKFTSHEGESLESYYLHFYKMMNELVRNQCIVTNHQVNVQFILQLKPEWKRFVTIVKQSQDLKNVSYHKLYDILKKHQNEVNEIRVERLACTAIPLVLVAQQQPVYPTSKPIHPLQLKVHQPDYKLLKPEIEEKEIDKLMDLISISSRGTGYDRQTGQYDNQRVVNVTGARENVRTQVVQHTRIQCYNCKEFGHIANECRKPKQARDSAYHKEKMLLSKQEEVGIQLSAEQVDWRDDADDEPEDQELEAHYIYMAKIQEVTPDAADNSGPIFDAEPLQKVHNCDDDYNVFANERQHPEQPEYVNDIYLMEQCDTNITSNSLDLSNNSEEADQDDQMLQKERELLASLIEQLKVEIDANIDSEFVKNACEKCATAYGLLEEQKVKSEKSFSAYTEKILNLNKKISEMENKLSAHKRIISTISFQKDEQEKVFKTREDKEIEKAINLEKHVKVLNDIVYKRGQSVQTMIMLNRNCKTSFVKPEYLKNAQSANPRSKFEIFKSLENEVESLRSQLETQITQFSNEIDRVFREYSYADHMNTILGVYTTLDEHSDLAFNYLETLEKCERLENELSQRTENVNNKSFNELSKRFSELEQHSINLELAL
ncbi:retrovirus-related pol polyprotein from transposon TNT 1-94 [Tanacetum coccineum]